MIASTVGRRRFHGGVRGREGRVVLMSAGPRLGTACGDQAALVRELERLDIGESRLFKHLSPGLRPLRMFPAASRDATGVAQDAHDAGGSPTASCASLSLIHISEPTRQAEI